MNLVAVVLNELVEVLAARPLYDVREEINTILLLHRGLRVIKLMKMPIEPIWGDAYRVPATIDIVRALPREWKSSRRSVPVANQRP